MTYCQQVVVWHDAQKIEKLLTDNKSRITAILDEDLRESEGEGKYVEWVRPAYFSSQQHLQTFLEGLSGLPDTWVYRVDELPPRNRRTTFIY